VKKHINVIGVGAQPSFPNAIQVGSQMKDVQFQIFPTQGLKYVHPFGIFKELGVLNSKVSNSPAMSSDKRHKGTWSQRLSAEMHRTKGRPSLRFEEPVK